MPTETLEASPSKMTGQERLVSTVLAERTTGPLRQLVETSTPARPVFATALLEMNRMGRPRRSVDYIFSLIFHSALLALLLVLPLYFAQGLHTNQFATTFLVAQPLLLRPLLPPLRRKFGHNGLQR